MTTRSADGCINTARVAGRRTLRFESIADIVAEINRLENAEVELLGNWSLGQIYWHLARGFDGAVDGVPQALAPWYLKAIGPLFKRRILNGRMGAGLKIPKAVLPSLVARPDVTSQLGLAELRQAIERFEREKHESRHPIFGNLTVDEWTLLMLRHCELHLSFVLPLNASHQN